MEFARTIQYSSSVAFPFYLIGSDVQRSIIRGLDLGERGRTSVLGDLEGKPTLFTCRLREINHILVHEMWFIELMWFCHSFRVFIHGK